MNRRTKTSKKAVKYGPKSRYTSRAKALLLDLGYVALIIAPGMLMAARARYA